MKITSRCGPRAIDELNDALLAKAHDTRLVRLGKVRADTTVVEANVAYPTDSGLLAKGVAKLARLTKQVHAAGLATRTKARDRTRSVRRRVHDIGAWLRRRSDEAKAEVLAINREVATIAEHAVADARRVALNARRGTNGLDTGEPEATRPVADRRDGVGRSGRSICTAQPAEAAARSADRCPRRRA